MIDWSLAWVAIQATISALFGCIVGCMIAWAFIEFTGRIFLRVVDFYYYLTGRPTLRHTKWTDK